MPTLSPSSTDDMNATLLKSNDGNDDTVKRELFGSFKGFSLKPLPMTKPNIIGASNVAYVQPVAKTETINEQNMPARAAPLPPSSSSPKKSQVKSSPISHHTKSSPSSIRYQNIDRIDKSSPETPIEVKLFASKSDAKERPKISNPVLENSTCSVKELIATANGNQSNSNALPKTIQTSNVLQKANQLQFALHKNPLADKSSLKKLEISSSVRPTSFGRSQSMRSPTSAKEPPKRNDLASGSMRYPGGVKRSATINRPKNPPPPRPSNPPADSMYNIYANTNDDDNSIRSIENSTDNIYCDIDEIKEPSPPNGLLSEIVNEIENRNLNSIYSTTKKPSNTKIDSKFKKNIDQRNNFQVNSPGLASESQKSDSDNSHIYMNTNSVEQPLILKSSSHSNEAKAQKSNVASIAKKLNFNPAQGISSKPIIAVKPPSNAVDQKGIINNTSSKSASQSDSTKKPYNVAKTGSSNSMGRPNIHQTSTVRSMHKRFENRNA